MSYPVGWDYMYHRWKNKEVSAKHAMEQLGLKSATFYNMAKKYESSIASQQNIENASEPLVFLYGFSKKLIVYI